MALNNPQFTPSEVDPEDEPLRPTQMSMDGGFRGDVAPRLVPLDSSPELLNIRFERKAIRKDFGASEIGEAASAPILALQEHKFISDDQSFLRLFRVFRNASDQAVLEVWDGTDWIEVEVSDEAIEEVYLSTLSSLGTFAFADGTHILAFREELEQIPTTLDFTGSITEVGQELQETVVAGSARVKTYEFKYSIDFQDANSEGSITIELLVNDEVVVERVEEFVMSELPFAAPLEREILFNHEIVAGDDVVVRVSERSVDGIEHVETFSQVGTPGTVGEPSHVADKGSDLEAVEFRYTFVYDVLPDILDGDVIGFYVDLLGDDNWILLTTDSFPTGTSFANVRQGVTVEGATEDSKFGIGLHVQDGGAGVRGFTINPKRLEWDSEGFVDFDVSEVSLEYDADGDPQAVFGKLSEDAPAARFILPFNNRILAFRDRGDVQRFAWSASGDITDWIIGPGSPGDAGDIFLVDSQSDGIDPLMGGAVVGPNTVAIFRKRSIMRAVETGSPALAMGVINWIDELGTDSPFSIKKVRGGAMFLGHDLQVYFLNEQGLQPIGIPIHQQLVETLTSNLELVDAAYDGIFQEYILGIPENGNPHIDAQWIFSVKAFAEEQRLVWRRREIEVQRFASASFLEEAP